MQYYERITNLKYIYKLFHYLRDYLKYYLIIKFIKYENTYFTN